jgi:CRP/FNR family transcriptional regulator
MMSGSAVQEHPLFAGLDPDRVARALHGVVPVRARRAALVMSPQSRQPGLVLCLEGRLISYELTEDGHELILDIVEPGGWDGLLTLTGREPHYTTAHCDSMVAVVDRRRFEALCAVEPKLGLRLADALAARLQAREHRLHLLHLNDGRRRVALQLLTLAQPDAGGGEAAIKVRLTHQQIGEMVGLRRETVTLALRDLEAQGAVRRRPDGFALDRSRLLSLLHGRLSTAS